MIGRNVAKNGIDLIVTCWGIAAIRTLVNTYHNFLIFKVLIQFII